MNSEREDISKAVRQWTPRILAGAVAGALAAIPMGLVMIGLNRYLPGKKRSMTDMFYALPPKQVTEKMSAWILGLEETLKITQPGKTWDWPTWLSHLGYGAATASVYPVVTRPLPLPNAARGILFALMVWSGSYLGWLPAANILPPATKQPARRNFVMILSHIVWGSLIGLFTAQLLALFNPVNKHQTTG